VGAKSASSFYSNVEPIHQNPRALLNLFYPGSFRDPLSLPLEEKSVSELKSPPESIDLAAMERRIIATISGRKPKKKPEPQSPFFKRQEVISLLKTRSVLERCEGAGWLEACVREGRTVLYLRESVLACIYRISQGEYPSLP
jgi:hypothetical protein